MISREKKIVFFMSEMEINGNSHEQTLVALAKLALNVINLCVPYRLKGLSVFIVKIMTLFCKYKWICKNSGKTERARA